MPFGRNARICLEHGGTNESTEHYQTVTYWYGRPGATLVRTDSLKIGDAASESGASLPFARRPPRRTRSPRATSGASIISGTAARSILRMPIAGGRRGGRRSSR